MKYIFFPILMVLFSNCLYGAEHPFIIFDVRGTEIKVPTQFMTSKSKLIANLVTGLQSSNTDFLMRKDDGSIYVNMAPELFNRILDGLSDSLDLEKMQNLNSIQDRRTLARLGLLGEVFPPRDGYLICGGRLSVDKGKKPTHVWWDFLLPVNSFRAINPRGRVNHQRNYSAQWSCNGKIIIAGGTDDLTTGYEQFSKEVDVIDPFEESSTPCAPLAQGTVFKAFSKLPTSDYCYGFGEHLSKQRMLKSLWRFDPHQNRWEKLSVENMPDNINGFASAVSTHDRCYIFYQNKEDQQDVVCFDPRSPKLEHEKFSGHGAPNLNAIAVADQIYLSGGLKAGDTVCLFNQVDPRKFKDTIALPAMPEPRMNHGSFGDSGNIYYVGGVKSIQGPTLRTNEYLTQIDCFDPILKTWLTLPKGAEVTGREGNICVHPVKIWGDL